MAETAKYEWSDAWLLLSVIYASREHPASLSEILMVGDYINHTGFTQEELDGGFSRLRTGEWLTRSADTFCISSKTADIYLRIATEKLSASGELKKIESVLGITNAP